MAITVEYLIVGSGSYGGVGEGPDANNGPGGWGAQVIANSFSAPNASYPVVVGVNGNYDSSFNGQTATVYGRSGGAGATDGLPGTNGPTSSISGTSRYYGSSGGGGGMASEYAGRGTGGGAGGVGAGNGGGDPGGSPQRGGNATFYGCGGGGGCTNSGAGGAGFSGVVVVRYAGSTVQATGGAITTIAGYVVHTFTSSGTFTLNASTVPTLTTILNYGGGAAKVFLGSKMRVTLQGSNFVSGATINVSGGITVSNIVVVSAAQITADFTGATVGAWSVSVTTVSGTSAAVTYTVSAVTALPNAGMLVNQVLAPTANQHPGSLGLHFTVGATDRMLTALGRWKFTGDIRKHTLWLRDDTWTLVASAVVDLSLGTVDSWVYTSITPVKLLAGRNYILTDMSVVNGGDKYADISHVVTDGFSTVNGIMVEVASMYSFALAATRADSYAAGYRFTATSAYNVMALGRWKIPGNSLAHRVVLKTAAGAIVRSAIVDFTGGKGVDSQFNYAPVAPYVLTAGAVYYVMSDEQGGDVWPEYPNTITPWGGLTITAGCYETYPSPNNALPNAAGTANTMWGAPDVLCWAAAWSNYPEAYVTPNLKWDVANILLAAQTSFSFSTTVAAPTGGAILAATSTLRFSTSVAAPISGAVLGAASRLSFSTIEAGLIIPEVWHPFYGAQINKTSGLHIHSE